MLQSSVLRLLRFLKYWNWTLWDWKHAQSPRTTLLGFARQVYCEYHPSPLWLSREHWLMHMKWASPPTWPIALVVHQLFPTQSLVSAHEARTSEKESSHLLAAP